MKAAKLIIFASPLPTHQWCVSAWLLIEDQIGLSQCGLVLCKFNCTTPLPAPELLTCRASQSQCGMATGPAGPTGLEGQTPLSQGRTSAPLPGTSLPGTSLRLGSLQTRSTPPFPPSSPVHGPRVWLWMENKAHQHFSGLWVSSAAHPCEIEIHPLPGDLELLIAAVNQQSVL